MSKPIVINAMSGVALPEKVEAGEAIVIQVAPEGKYPQIVDDPEAEGGQREVVQILDRKAMDTLVENFERERAAAEAKGEKYGVLVDADHSSETSTNTAAMGWVTRLFVDPEKGLMAEIEPTSLGAEKINGKVYRFVSGAWTLDAADRPERLVSIGLTNKPNLPVSPMTNAAKEANNADPGTAPDTGAGVTDDGGSAAGGDATGYGEAGADEPTAGSVQEEEVISEGDGNMNLKEKLGLPEEATDADIETAVDALIERCAGMEQVQNALGLEETATNEEVLNAVEAVINQCGDLQAKNEEAEKAALANAADALIAENEDVIPEEVREEVREEFIEDPEKAEQTVANFRRIYDRAVRNAMRMGSGEQKVKTAVVFRNAEASRPSVGIAGIIASCGGDARAINAAIAQMHK